MENLYFSCQKYNRLFYNGLYEAFVNRNEAEAKEIANLAIDKNIEFTAEYLNLVEEPRRAAAKSILVELMSIEALERAFSRIQLPNDDIKPLVKRTTKSIERLTLRPEDIRHKSMEQLLEQRMADFKALAKDVGDRAFRQDDFACHTLRAICKYHLIFRAVRELYSSFHEKARAAQIDEKREILERAIKYADLALSVDKYKIEAFLVKATIHRQLGAFDNSTSELWSAFYTLAWAWQKLDEALIGLMNTSPQWPEEDDRITACRELAPFKDRIVNDLARILETLAIASEAKLAAFDPNDALVELGLQDKTMAQLVTEMHIADAQSCAYSRRINKIIRSAIKVFKTPEAKPALNKALEFWHELEDFDHKKNAHPDHTYLDLFGREAQTLLRKEHADCATALSELKQNPRAFEYLHNMGRIFVLLGQDTKALDYYKQSLNADPDYTAARENLALLLLAREDCPSADRHLTIARRIYESKDNPRRTQLVPNLADVILAESARKKLLQKYLVQASTLDKLKNSHLAILRRWNSYTPSVPTKPKSVGGGYFLSVGDKGIVIDPGFDFLHNFAEAGYSVSDIHYIFVSHLHADHVNDLEPILLLLQEQTKRTGLKGSDVCVCAATDVLDGLTQRLKALEIPGTKKPFLPNVFFAEVPLDQTTHSALMVGRLQTKRSRERPLDGFRVQAIHTYRHFGKAKGTSGPDQRSCGFKFYIPRSQKHEDESVIGFTSDTGWSSKLAEHFKDCELLVAHIGELFTNDINEIGQLPKNLDADNRHHLGLYGIYSLIRGIFALHIADGSDKNSFPLQMAIISEFGEELGVYRSQIAKRLNDTLFDDQIPTLCLTGDLDLRIRLPHAHGTAKVGFEVKCKICGNHRYRQIGEIDEFVTATADGDSEVIHFCRRHDESIIRDKLQARSFPSGR